jgi:hypothetical protein
MEGEHAAIGRSRDLPHVQLSTGRGAWGQMDGLTWSSVIYDPDKPVIALMSAEPIFCREPH